MTLFENVDTITINNKEVKSIITSNGAVLYQKAEEEYIGEMEIIVDEFIIKIPSYDFLIFGLSAYEMIDKGLLNDLTIASLNENQSSTCSIDFMEEIGANPLYEYGVDFPIPGDSSLSDLTNGIDIAQQLENFLYYIFAFLYNSDDYTYERYPVTYTATDNTHLTVIVNTSKLSFSEETYNATNGSCTLTCKLSKIDGDISGKTITVTGSDGSEYTSTTDSNGVATFEITSCIDLTLTAKYSNIETNCEFIANYTKPTPTISFTYPTKRTSSTVRSDTITVTVKYGGTPLEGITIHAKTTTYITGYNGVADSSDVTTDANGQAKIICYNSSKMTKIVINQCYTTETNCYKKASKTGTKTY